jgi:hypothetical protein
VSSCLRVFVVSVAETDQLPRGLKNPGPFDFRQQPTLRLAQ